MRSSVCLGQYRAGQKRWRTEGEGEAGGEVGGDGDRGEAGEGSPGGSRARGQRRASQSVERRASSSKG
eukprot:380075-Rhodomonas_salina.1